MTAARPDRSDPAVRADLRLAATQRRQRMTRAVAAFALFAVAAVGPFVAQRLVGDPGAVFGTTIASLLLVGCGVAAWPRKWSDPERQHHTLAAIWAEARAGAPDQALWTRYAAWAEAHGDRVDLVLLSQAGCANRDSAVGSFSKVVTRSIDADAIADAATAMEELRSEARDREEHAQQRYLEEAAAGREPLDDALRAVDESAAAEQHRAEQRMLQELAAQEAAEREAQAGVIARALRRP